MSSSTSPATGGPLTLRPGRLDLVLTAVVSALGLYLAYDNYHSGWNNPASDGGPIHLSVIGIPAFLILTLPLLYRTSAPRLGLLLTSVAMVVYWAIFGRIVHCGAAYPAVALLAYGAGRRLRGEDRVIGFGLAMLAAVSVGLTDALDPGTMVLGVPLALIGFGIGVAVAAVTTRKRRSALVAMHGGAPASSRAALRENVPA
jgi:hypothetical protein